MTRTPTADHPPTSPTRLAGKVDLVIVDVRTELALVVADRIYAAPTLVKQLPEPLRRLVGDLSDAVRVRERLDLAPVTVHDG